MAHFDPLDIYPELSHSLPFMWSSWLNLDLIRDLWGASNNAMDAGGWTHPGASAVGKGLVVPPRELHRDIHGEAGENGQPEDLHAAALGMFALDLFNASPATSLQLAGANPAAIGGDSPQQTGTPRLGVLASEDNATAEQQQCETHNDNPGVIAGDSTQQTGTRRLRVLASEDNATAEQQQCGNEGAGVGVGVGDIAGADADDADADPKFNADAGPKADATAEQQYGNQGAYVGAGGDTAGASDGSTGPTIIGLLQQMTRHKSQAGASASNDGDRPASTTNMQRSSALGNMLSRGDTASDTSGSNDDARPASTTNMPQHSAPCCFGSGSISASPSQYRSTDPSTLSIRQQIRAPLFPLNSNQIISRNHLAEPPHNLPLQQQTLGSTVGASPAAEQSALATVQPEEASKENGLVAFKAEDKRKSANRQEREMGEKGNKRARFMKNAGPTPTTSAPITPTPTTSTLITQTPITPAPITPAPITPAPITPTPITPPPITPTPTTSPPLTATPITPTPTTSPPITGTPITLTPTTSPPITASPVTPTLTNSTPNTPSTTTHTTPTTITTPSISAPATPTAGGSAASSPAASAADMSAADTSAADTSAAANTTPSPSGAIHTWRDDGRKTIYTEEEFPFKRIYYKCSLRSAGCPAKKTVDYVDGQSPRIKVIVTHEHVPLARRDT